MASNKYGTPGEKNDYIIVSIEEDENATISEEFQLLQNYPNPFNSSTTIRYSLNRDSRTEIIVFDLLGHKLAALVDEYRDAGTHEISWDASGLPAGVYLYHVKSETSGKEKLGKFAIIK